MTSKTRDVAAYLKDVPAERREAVEKLRDLCRRHLPGAEESMDYGMPTYMRQGTMVFAFASQKQHIALYAGEKVAGEFREALPQASCGKGCLRFKKPEHLDFPVIEQVIRRCGS